MNNNDINFEYIEDFVSYIVDTIAEDNELYVTVIAKFDEMRDIIKCIMLYEDIDFEVLNLECPEISGYEDEFVLGLWINDGVLEIGCEKLKDDDGEYLYPGGDITFLSSNASSKIISLCDESELYFVNVDECSYAEDYEDCCSCDCHKDDIYVECSVDKNGDTHGFTASKSDDNGYYSFSYYTNDKLSKKDIRLLLEEFRF